MNTTPASPPNPTGRALVLGGGGSTGHAWLIGVVAGLAEAGLDVTNADRVVGTSAGSTAAAQITTHDVGPLFEAALEAPPAGSGATRRPVLDHLERMRRLLDESASPADMRRRLGAAALARSVEVGDVSPRWRDTVAARLPGVTWPDRDLLITAVDARTGEPVVFDRRSGVDLVDAVAASCSSGFAYTTGTGRYIDGGHRTNAENADLARGCARVLVLSPLGGVSWTPSEWGLHLSSQVEALRAGGSEVEVVAPPPGAADLFGAAAMDVTLRPAAARVGHDQGMALGRELATFWGRR